MSRFERYCWRATTWPLVLVMFACGLAFCALDAAKLLNPVFDGAAWFMDKLDTAWGSRR